MRVRRFSGDAKEWDDFVVSAPGWTHFHLFGWKHVVDRVFGHECIYLEARDEAGSLQGVLPLVRVRSLIFGHFLVSMPFVNYGGPLGRPEAVATLVEHAVAMAASDRAGLLELRSRRALPIDLAVSHRKLTVLLDLPKNSEILWKHLDRKVRNHIRRGQKEELTMRFGVEQIAPFFDLFARRMRDLGTPTQPRRLFEAIAEIFPADVWFGCAYRGDKAVAGGCGFRWNGEFEMTWSAASEVDKQLQPNVFLFWSFMARAIGENVRIFNFGRCTPGSGTHRFKLQWGSRDEPLWWYGAFRENMAATPAPTDARYAWGPFLWRHLPLPLANFLGPQIVRYIP